MTIFHASSAQHELIDSFVRPLDELFPYHGIHQSQASDYDHWRTAAEFGWFGVSLPEAIGGIGLTAVEEALLFAQFGRHLISPSFMAATLAAKTAALSGDAALALKILSGELPVAMARRTAQNDEIVLFDADRAQLCLVGSPHDTEIFQADTIEYRTMLDQSQWSIQLESARLTVDPIALCPENEIAIYATLLVAAQLTGIASAALDMAVSYSLLRQQFGAPIGSFQAIKHHCADMAMHAQAAKDLLSFSAVAMVENRPDYRFQIAAALNVSIRAALFNARTNIQIHGGMGFSAECDAHLFLKRAHVLENLVGGLKTSRTSLRSEVSIFDKESTLIG